MTVRLRACISASPALWPLVLWPLVPWPLVLWSAGLWSVTSTLFSVIRYVSRTRHHGPSARVIGLREGGSEGVSGGEGRLGRQADCNVSRFSCNLAVPGLISRGGRVRTCRDKKFGARTKQPLTPVAPLSSVPTPQSPDTPRQRVHTCFPHLASVASRRCVVRCAQHRSVRNGVAGGLMLSPSPKISRLPHVPVTNPTSSTTHLPSFPPSYPPPQLTPQYSEERRKTQARKQGQGGSKKTTYTWKNGITSIGVARVARVRDYEQGLLL